MLFSEALEALVAGKFVSRSAWDATGEYCALMPGMSYVWKILTAPTPNAGNHIFSVADFMADDWKAYIPGSRGIAVGEYNPADPTANHAPNHAPVVPPCS